MSPASRCARESRGRLGDRVSVVAELLSVSTGNAIWSRSLEMRTAELLAVRDSLARAIGTAMQVRLRRASVSAGSTDPEIRDLLLRGRYALARSDFPIATAALTRALARDSLNVAVNAELAAVYVSTTSSGYASPDSVLPLAGAALRRAQQSAPGDAETLVAESIVEGARFQWQRAYEAARRAVALDSLNLRVLNQAAFAAANVGRLKEAVQFARVARAIDPLDARVLVQLQYVELLEGRASAAIELGRQILELDPLNENALINNAISYAVRGELDAAEAAARQASVRQRFATPLELALILALRNKRAVVDSIRTAVRGAPVRSNSPALEEMFLALAIGSTTRSNT